MLGSWDLPARRDVDMLCHTVSWCTSTTLWNM